MPKKHKNRLKGVTFQLVHRSQDLADESTPERVWMRVPDKQSRKHREEQLEEQAKYGINFQDDTNYLEHLKDVADNRLEWPEHVEKMLAERYKKTLEKSDAHAAELDINMEDEEFDYDDPDNELEDDFVALGGGIASDHDEEDDDEDEEVQEIQLQSSGSLVRNEQLTLLDRRFERMLEQYNEEEEEEENADEEENDEIYQEMIMKCAEDYEEQQKPIFLEKSDDLLKTKTLELAQIIDETESKPNWIVVKETPKFDCMSILSLKSNTRNLPKLIEIPKKITVNKLTGVPKDSTKLTSNAINQLNRLQENDNKSVAQSIISQLSELSIRPTDETPEQRRLRKRNLKEYRHERRMERKLNSLAFKEEGKRQVKIAINNRNNVQGNRLL